MGNKQIKMRLTDGVSEKVLTDDDQTNIFGGADLVPESEESGLSKRRTGMRIAASSEVFGDYPRISRLTQDPTADLPAQEDFVQEEVEYDVRKRVFTLSDLPEGRGSYLDLVELATGQVDPRKVGILGPQVLYHGKVMPAFEVQLREMRMPEEDRRFILARANGILDRSTLYSTTYGMNPEMAMRFAMGVLAHQNEAETRTRIEELESKVCTPYDDLDSRRNRLLEPKARKYDHIGR